jgi:alkylation response protein AidB-like acyl-CoA dehydrogenase
MPDSTPASTKVSKLPPFDWTDPFYLADQLDEEERMTFEAGVKFVEAELEPGVMEANRNQTFDRNIYKKLGQSGFLGVGLEGYGCPGGSAVMYGLLARAVEGCDSAYRSAMSVQSSLDVPNPYIRLRRAETEISAKARFWRARRVFWLNRAGPWFRCWRYEVSRSES